MGSVIHDSTLNNKVKCGCNYISRTKSLTLFSLCSKTMSCKIKSFKSDIILNKRPFIMSENIGWFQRVHMVSYYHNSLAIHCVYMHLIYTGYLNTGI